MNIEELEQAALLLSENDRAELAEKLLLSLENPSDAEIEQAWITEALRRAREVEEGLVEPIAMDEVRRKIQSLLR